MNIHKTFFTLSALLAISLFAAGMSYLTGGISDSPKDIVRQGGRAPEKRSKLFGSTWRETPDSAKNRSESADSFEQTLVFGELRPIRYTLPGVFRGEWGGIPVYAKNDRVNHEDAAYLSLEDGNQNQPPATSPNYWRLLKTFKQAGAQVCQSPKPGSDLSKCDFSSEFNLKDRDLRGAVLKKARLSGELGSADLSGADLSGAAVIGSLVIGPSTSLKNANLSKLQSDGNNLLIADSADLNHTNLTEAKLYGAKLSHANLEGSQLNGSTLTGADLSVSHLQGADMTRAKLSFSNLSGGMLADAALGEADLSESDLSGSDFSRANLRRAKLAGADLGGSDFSGADLSGADLRSAKHTELAAVDNETDFTSAVCPDGVTVDGTQVTTCIGHGF